MLVASLVPALPVTAATGLLHEDTTVPTQPGPLAGMPGRVCGYGLVCGGGGVRGSPACADEGALGGGMGGIGMHRGGFGLGTSTGCGCGYPQAGAGGVAGVGYGLRQCPPPPRASGPALGGPHTFPRW